MIRLIGAVFVILSTTYLGFDYSRNLQLRIRHLMNLKQIFTEIYSDVEYGACTLMESFTRIAVKQERQFQLFLDRIVQGMKKDTENTMNMPFHIILEEAVNYALADSCLLDEDKEELIRLGKQLGNNQRKGQLRLLEIYLQELDTEIEVLEKDRKDKQNISRILGISSGVLIVILLL